MVYKKIAIIKLINIIFLIVLVLNCYGFSNKQTNLDNKDIIIENAEMRLILGVDGAAKSLIHKATEQECLKMGVNIPAFSITQDMPYDNKIRLAYPAKSKTFGADSLHREGDNLIVGFELVDYEAVINLNITDNYIGFTLEKMRSGGKRKPRVDEFIFLQLPVKDRPHFGEWLNVLWDEDVAVNLLATDLYCRIDAEKRQGYKIFQAGGVNEVKMEDVGAALITTDKSKLLDRIDRVERDYNLPLGVESRRSEEYKNSYYEIRGVLTLENIDEHIAFAKKAGFRQMVVHYLSFVKSMGHFIWRKEFPNGMEDLKIITQKIRDAGMLPGLHTHYNKASIDDPYVTPVPDTRLNLRRIFTLRENLNENATTISVEENPAGCTLENKRRMLKIGTEMISYENYTTKPPYQFVNCKRGVYGTTPEKQKRGAMFGLLDIDSWPIFVRFNQNTDIQEEVSERLAKIIDECGFRFIYFDGAEDVNPPYWYNVAKAQLSVYDALEIKPILAEGAQKPHFGWHLLTRGNAFDYFRPEVVKEATREYPLKEIKFISNDFSSINFGWNNYVVPSARTIGMQPDMFEYITSRAAAWNSIISIAGVLDKLKNHPRTDDNLEVIRRWEEVRATGFLTKKQIESLKNEGQEHILLINEEGKLELLPYDQIMNVANGRKDIRAFIFERNYKTWVVYWHTFGEGNIELPVTSDKIHLFEKLGKEIPFQKNDVSVVLPAGKRRYLQVDLTRNEVKNLFSRITLVK